MTIKTKSSFIYDFVIDASSTFLNFNEGSIELTASLEVGSYSMTGMANQISSALNNSGSLVYTVTVDRDTRLFTISAPTAFNLLSNTGSNVGLSGWAVFGFDTLTDKTGLSSYEGSSAAGRIFSPQFFLQDYIPFINWQGFASSTINESASGVVEVYSLGSRQFSEMNITNQNNGIAGSVNGNLEFSNTGEDDLRSFLVFATTKGPIEFMPDRATLSVFNEMILESSPGSKSGTEFKMIELTKKNRAGWFESGKLKFRKQ